MYSYHVYCCYCCYIHDSCSWCSMQTANHKHTSEKEDEGERWRWSDRDGRMKMRWRDMKWNEMKWDEMKWDEMKWNDMRWNEMKWNEMRWNEMRWDEMSWDEMKWNEMRWDEMKWNEQQIDSVTHHSWCFAKSSQLMLCKLITAHADTMQTHLMIWLSPKIPKFSKFGIKKNAFCLLNSLSKSMVWEAHKGYPSWAGVPPK